MHRFREQHADILAVAGDLGRRLADESFARDAHGVRSGLSALIGRLRAHLALEDRHLYPTLLRSSSATVRATAKSFMDEMGGLVKQVESYAGRWPHAMAIQRDPSAFAADTQGLLRALRRRIAREDADLYVLAGQVIV